MHTLSANVQITEPTLRQDKMGLIQNTFIC